jgi:DNA-binding transcriptional LysR family regulator
MRDLSFDDLHLFARVAELGSLSAAARERDAPVSQVSRTLKRIETTCGVRLLHRSTHGLTATAEGQTFLQYCKRLTGTLDELEGEFAGQSREASGWVRVAASTVVAEYLLIPGFASLRERHPGLKVELQVEDRMVDMARDGIDIAIRSGPPLADTVVAKQLGILGRRLYATPAYLKAHGSPQHPDDLLGHTLITSNSVTALNRWPFVVDGKPYIFQAEGTWRADSTSMTAKLALEGLGISRFASLVAEPLVRQGSLVPVLPAYVDEQPSPIHAVTLTSRHRLPKIRACIDHWVQSFGSASLVADKV